MQSYVCATCKKKGVGLYVAGGWWQYPPGWFVHDNGDRWICSERCATQLGTVPPPAQDE